MEHRNYDTSNLPQQQNPWGWWKGSGKITDVMLGKKDGKTLIAIVPDHKGLERGTLKSILRQANLSLEEFLETLD